MFRCVFFFGGFFFFFLVSPHSTLTSKPHMIDGSLAYVDMPKSNTTIIWDLYLSGMWFGIDLRIDITLDYVLITC